VNTQIGIRDLKYAGKICPLCMVTGCGACAAAANALSVVSIGNIRTHNSRIDSCRIFKLGGGDDHVTPHVWPLIKVKRSKSQNDITYQQQEHHN